MPKLEAPARKGKLFNLRIYESHNEAAGQKKIEMFNKARSRFSPNWLTPVLFGEAVVELGFRTSPIYWPSTTMPPGPTPGIGSHRSRMAEVESNP